MASSQEQEEPILNSKSVRYALYPIIHHQLFDKYKQQLSSIWSVGEVDLSKDKLHWQEKLNEDERRAFLTILGFFVTADSIVSENVITRFCTEVKIPEARHFFNIQAVIEDIHSEMYSILVQTLTSDDIDLQNSLYRSIETMECVKRKALFAIGWMHNLDAPFSSRLVAFAAVEGIFFSASFAAIYWLKKRGLMPGLAHSNELISRDEGLHCDFACLLFKELKNRPPNDVVYKIITEAVEIEKFFFEETLSVDLKGLNKKQMFTYIEFIADRLLGELGYNKIYNVTNPLDFMENIALEGKTNFFEKRVGEYKKFNVYPTAPVLTREFTTDAEF